MVPSVSTSPPPANRRRPSRPRSPNRSPASCPSDPRLLQCHPAACLPTDTVATNPVCTTGATREHRVEEPQGATPMHSNIPSPDADIEYTPRTVGTYVRFRSLPISRSPSLIPGLHQLIQGQARYSHGTLACVSIGVKCYQTSPAPSEDLPREFVCLRQAIHKRNDSQDPVVGIVIYLCMNILIRWSVFQISSHRSPLPRSAQKGALLRQLYLRALPDLRSAVRACQPPASTREADMFV